MAFKVAENSLFVVLSRSAWWYSVLIGLFFIAISLVVASGKYVALGVFTSFPFFGIAIYSGYKQFQQPSSKRMIEVAAQAREMNAMQIAEKIAESYIEARYESSEFKGNEAELILTRSNRKLLLCSKRFKVVNTGIEPLKQLVAAGKKVEATGYLHVALGEISAAALEYAGKNNIDLIQADRLAGFFDKKIKLRDN